jgi:NAD(P)-dependent dehydrogenase (short-subunit alcohol dehydrogenase family)
MSIALVTGANRGIGLELVKQLLPNFDEVIAACRSKTPELEETGATIIEGIDVTNSDSLKSLENALNGKKVSLLLNNAGILRDETLDHFDLDSIREQFEVNTLGPLRVTHTLLNHLQDGGKVAMVTSRMGSIADNTSGGRYGYRMSKSALNMGSVSLAHDLSPRQIKVGIFHPGWVRTDMTGHSGHLEPHEAAAGIIKGIEKLSSENSGSFWHSNGELLPW